MPCPPPRALLALLARLCRASVKRTASCQSQPRCQAPPSALHCAVHRVPILAGAPAGFLRRSKHKAVSGQLCPVLVLCWHPAHGGASSALILVTNRYTLRHGLGRGAQPGWAYAVSGRRGCARCWEPKDARPQRAAQRRQAQGYRRVLTPGSLGNWRAPSLRLRQALQRQCRPSAGREDGSAGRRP